MYLIVSEKPSLERTAYRQLKCLQNKLVASSKKPPRSNLRWPVVVTDDSSDNALDLYGQNLLLAFPCLDIVVAFFTLRIFRTARIVAQ